MSLFIFVKAAMYYTFQLYDVGEKRSNSDIIEIYPEQNTPFLTEESKQSKYNYYFQEYESTKCKIST